MWLHLLDRFRALEMVLACLIFVVLVAIVAAGTVARYLGVPLITSLEVVQALFVWLCVLAADLTLQRNGHFSVDLVTSLLPRPVQRGLDIIILLIVAALLLFLLWHGTRFTLLTHDRPMPLTGVPSSYVTGALPVGFALMLITIAERVQGILSGRVVAGADRPREVL